MTVRTNGLAAAGQSVRFYRNGTPSDCGRRVFSLRAIPAAQVSDSALRRISVNIRV